MDYSPTDYCTTNYLILHYVYLQAGKQNLIAIMWTDDHDSDRRSEKIDHVGWFN